MGAAVDGRQLRCCIAGRQLIAESFVRDRSFTKICAGPSGSRSLVFLNDSLDLMWWPRGGKKPCERTERRILAINSSFCWWTCQHPRLLRAFQTACSPQGPEGCSLTENMPFGEFRAGLHPLKLPSGCWRYSDFLRIGRHIQRAWICWTFLSDAFCRRKARQQLTPIWAPYFRPSLWNGTG